MSITTQLGLFKHDNPETNTDTFNIEKALNENWDKIDESISENKEEISLLNETQTDIKQTIQELNTNKADKEDVYTKEEIENKLETGEFKGTDGKSAYEIGIQNGFEGSEEEWLASLKGKDGIDGINGVDGIDGQNGKSAYEIAVENGFTGTEDEWLDSLKGQQGEKGEQGIQGLKGDKGDKGETGDPASYDDTELQNRITEIENNIGDISTILDNINGEVL